MTTSGILMNCLNGYFAPISSVNYEHTQLPPFIKLNDNSVSHINCTGHETELAIEVLSANNASGDDEVIKYSRVSPNLFQNPYVF